MQAVLIRSTLLLNELANQIYGDVFRAKFEERESLNKGGIYYRAYGLLCDFSLMSYGDEEFIIIIDSKSVFKDEDDMCDFFLRKIKEKLNMRDIESEVIDL
jgi:hypothetical protein